MRGKSFIIIILGVVVLTALILLNRPHKHPDAPDAAKTTVEGSAEAGGQSTTTEVTQPTPNSASSVASTAAKSDPEMELESPNAAILEQIYHDLDAGDPVALRRITDRLRHPDSEVRAAAREALRYADDRQTIPDIELAAAATTDEGEKAELEELIEYLNLPSLTELQAARALANNSQTSASTPQTKRSSRFTGSTAAATAEPTPAQSYTPEQIAAMQAEIDRLKKENQEIKAILSPVVPKN